MITIKNFSFFFFFTLFMVSCSEPVKGFKEHFDGVEEKHLVSEKVNIVDNSEAPFAQIPEMLYVGGLLIVNDIHPNYTMKIIDLKTNQVRNFGKKGRGPNEYQSPFSKLAINHHEKKLYISDFPTYRIYDIDSLKNGYDKPLSSFRIHSEDLRFLISTYNNGYIVGNTYQDKCSFYDIEKDEIKRGEYKYDKSGALGSQGNFFGHPSEAKLVNLQFSSEVINIITIDSMRLKFKELTWWVDNSKQITDDKGRTYAKSTEDSKHCFTSATVTKEYIYALFSGKSIGKTKKSVEDSRLANMIYVMDWEGMPVKKYKLDQNVLSIAIDEKSNIIYAASHKEGEVQIVKYFLG